LSKPSPLLFQRLPTLRDYGLLTRDPRFSGGACCVRLFA
jgi:hypothetical protein